MAIYSLKKSYQLKNLSEINFNDLWGEHGIFTTMWIYGKPTKILFFKEHINTLIKSLKKYGIRKKTLKKDILNIINQNISKKKRYNHLLRIAVTKNIISISLRKRVAPKKDFNLELVNLKRDRPKYKNLKYKKILFYLSKLDNSRSDVALISNKKILETGTANIFFVKDGKFYIPKKNYYFGNTLKFFKTKIRNIVKKDIFIDKLMEYDEIILVGSGKGVVSVKTINQIDWKRKSLKQFRLLFHYYRKVSKKYNFYKF
tara:strand:- start:159 stop:932 length:774 start_codon:yes stop_codon:yes gene_type:complete